MDCAKTQWKLIGGNLALLQVVADQNAPNITHTNGPLTSDIMPPLNSGRLPKI